MQQNTDLTWFSVFRNAVESRSLRRTVVFGTNWF